MEIAIKKEKESGALLAYSSGKCLFDFQYRKGEKSWYFYGWGRAYRPLIFKGRFPLEYFKNACRANHFIEFAEGIDEEVTVVKGRNYIGLK